MSEYQLRVVEEQKQLQERLEKLRGFLGCAIFQTLGERDQELLQEQAKVMEKYLEILQERISRFV